MPATFNILVNEKDVQAFTDFNAEVQHRIENRQKVTAILLEHLEPLVEEERSILSKHDKSGALSMSLRARAGSGDRSGTISVFSLPTAKVDELRARWGGASARTQQKGWASRLTGRGRRNVFYGPIVHQGHRIVKRNKAGELVDTGDRVEAIPFAAEAVDAIGDEQAEAAAQAVLNYIFGD